MMDQRRSTGFPQVEWPRTRRFRGAVVVALRPSALSVRAKLAGLIAVPLVMLIPLSASQIADASSARSRAQTLVGLARLSTLTTSLVHSLQAERGATNTFIAAKGRKMTDKLPGLRQSTTEAKVALKNYLAGGPGIDGTVLAASTSALGAFDGLDTTRSKADALNLTGPEAVGYYTTGIGGLLRSLSPMAESAGEAHLAAQISAIQSFAQAKERMGQERAQLSGVLAAGSYAPGQQAKINGLSAAREAFLTSYAASGGAAAEGAAKALLDTEAAQRVAKMETDNFSRITGFTTTAEDWFAAATARIDEMRAIEVKSLDAIGSRASDLAATATRNLALLVSGLVAAIALTVGLAAWQMKRLCCSLANVRAVLERLGEGHLTDRITVTSQDEIGRMGLAVNGALDALEASLGDVRSRAAEVNSGAGALTAASEAICSAATDSAGRAVQTASSARQVSDAVGSVATASEEMAASIAEIARSAAHAQGIAANAVEVASHARETVAELGVSSERIGDVLKAVAAIAEQTNLLALNATIEAARAGEAGKGFAVVASEVKDLARETSEATEDIARQIDQLRSDSRAAAQTIGEITTVIGQMSEVQATISAAVEEQDATTREIEQHVRSAAAQSTSIADIVDRVAGDATGAQQAAGSNSKTASRLSGVAGELDAIVGRFHFTG